MARRIDSGWRDGTLAAKHAGWGHAFPVAGMAFPMVEYDQGVPLAVISYIRRGEELPTGGWVSAAYSAFSNMYRETGEQLPFFTVQYDPRNWAYRIFGHNVPARDFLGTGGWHKMTEVEFVANLYRLRGRIAPDLSPYGVVTAHDPWIETEPSPDFHLPEVWPHQLMSTRRRCFEPVGQTRLTWRNPCVDIDLALVDASNRVSLVVDYKAPNAKVNVASTNMQTLSGLRTRQRGMTVPAMVAQYLPDESGWTFRVHCLNKNARLHLAYVLGLEKEGSLSALAHTIAGGEWVSLTEVQWRNVLNCARDL